MRFGSMTAGSAFNQLAVSNLVHILKGKGVDVGVAF